MTEPCSYCSRWRSEAARRRPPAIGGSVAALALGVLALAPSPARAADGAGTVHGTVTVEHAAIRADGPKHDRDVVVMLEPVGPTPPPVADARATMDQKGLVFVPHVLAVQRGTTVTFLNNDREQHNVYFLDDATGDTLDIGTYGPGVSVDHTFTTPGMVIVLCKLHLEMAAFVVVTDTPWFTQAVLDPDSGAASFTLEGVPAGRYELRLWHKKLEQKGGPATITVPRGEVTEVAATITKPRYAALPP